jgi:hypothetical protein
MILDMGRRDMGDSIKTKRQSVQIENDAHEAFAKVCDARRVKVKYQDAASEILRWFARQPQLVQSAILSEVDEGMEIGFATALESLAAELRLKAGASRRMSGADATLRRREESPEPETQPEPPAPRQKQPSQRDRKQSREDRARLHRRQDRQPLDSPDFQAQP